MTINTCQQCLSSFAANPKALGQKFCSRECWRLSRIRQVSRTCERCGKVFSVYQARRHARFCSWECHTAKVTKGCLVCGATITVKQSAGPKRLTCSRRCRAILQNMEHRSPRQGQEKSAEERQKISEGLRKYYKWSPAKHWNYQGGPWPSRRGGWLKQRDAARERDGNTCRACLKSAASLGRNIPVHHIKPYREFPDPESANDLANLISLCQSCHMKAEHGKIAIIPRRP